MINLQRAVLAMTSVCVAVAMSGCCVTSISCRKSCQTNAAPCQQEYYEPIPSDVGPITPPPALEQAPAPTPVPPSPASAKRSLGTRTTQMVHSIGDSLRDTFTR
ncbi:MAG: hypothetical protein JSS49_29545 [Planctomycetes bacterium]|nr:hypothetical protein [Planctomycetota bacterium]